MKVLPGSFPENPKYPGSAFAIYNGKVFYHGCDSVLRCYDLTGQLQWKQNIDARGQFLTFYDVFVLAQTVQKGEKGYGRFALNDGHYNHSTPIRNMTSPPEQSGGYIYFNSMFEDGGFSAYDPALDSIVWKTFVTNELESPPIYSARAVFLRKDKNNITALNLKSGKPMFQKAQHKVFYPVVANKFFSIGTEGLNFTVIDNRNFDKIEWKKSLRSPLYHGKIFNNRLIAVTQNMNLQIWDLRDKKLLKKVDLNKLLAAQGAGTIDHVRALALEKRKLYLSLNEGRWIWVIDIESGQTLDYFDLLKYMPVHSPEVSMGNAYFISGKDGGLYSIGETVKEKEPKEKTAPKTEKEKNTKPKKK